MYLINQHDERWLDALREIGAEIKPGRVVAFIREANGYVNAAVTLRRFFEHFGLEENIKEKFIEHKNVDVRLCGCIYKNEYALHLCQHHGPCSALYRLHNVNK